MLRIYPLSKYIFSRSYRTSYLPRDYLNFEAKNGILLNGTKFSLKGCNWFGFETETHSPHGLWQVSLESLLDLLQKYKFNALRVPFSAELALGLDTIKPTAINYSVNPSLQGLTAGKLFDRLVAECKKRGILVMPDLHRMVGTGQITELWYEGSWTEAKIVEAWSKLVNRYKNEPFVFAADIKNEPHGKATWGGPKETDWAAAAERIGNALLKINPRLLIFVEGTDKTTKWGSFWGGNLEGVATRPIKLAVANRLVFSPHVYGWDVYQMNYFKEANFPQNMPAIWDQQWGYLAKSGQTVCVTEWGGRAVPGTPDNKWHGAFSKYLLTNNVPSFYWVVNENSQDTLGIVDTDWKTPIKYKFDFIAQAHPNPTIIKSREAELNIAEANAEANAEAIDTIEL